MMKNSSHSPNFDPLSPSQNNTKKHRLPKGPDTPSKKRGAGFAKVMSRETIPKCCLYGIFTQIWLKCMVNVSKHYSIHGSYWNRKFPTGETHTSTPPSTWRNRQLFHPSWEPQSSPNWLMIVKHLYDALEKNPQKVVTWYSDAVGWGLNYASY